nr:reverse transcriptase domain-containing protein [Tanacetum cinerariifolium]
MTKRRRGNHAAVQVVFFPKAKPDTVAGEPGQWSPRVSVSNQPLTLTSEFGHGINPEARLSRVVSVCRNPTPASTGGTLGADKNNQSRNLLQQIDAIRGTLFLNYLEFRMTCSTPDPTTPDQSPSLQHVSSLETLNKQHNEKSGTLVTPLRLTFEEEADSNKGKYNEKGATEGVDDDLKKPYKEVLESPFTRRIIEFSAPSHRMPTNLRVYDGFTDPDDHISRFVGAANQGEWEMPVWCRMFQQTLDGPARGWFDRMPNGYVDSWANLRERFVERFALRRRCIKYPIEVLKIVQRANETFPNFKECWTKEMGYIQGVPEVMQISAFMSNSKCPELARRFANQVPQTITEMMKRVDDFVKSKKAFKSTKLPRGSNRRGDRGRRTRDFIPRLPPPPSLVGTSKRENLDRYCDYHGEKGHYTNDCFQLKKQLEITLKSGKLNHLVKDVRHRGGNRGKQVGNSREQLLPIGKIELEVMFGSEGLSRRTMMKFTVVQASSPYNIILGRTRIRELRAILSTTHAMMKFLTPRWIAILVPRRDAISECRQLENKQNYLRNTVLFSLSSLIDKFVKRQQGRVRLAAFEHGRHPEMDKSTFFKRESECHSGSIKTKGHELGEEQGRDEGGRWHMENVHRLQEPQFSVSKRLLPLLEIDLKIEAMMGFPFKCFLDAYKGYHRIQMSEEDEEKMTFYTDLEAYVDDMITKSRTHKDIIIDVAKTFNNLRKRGFRLIQRKKSGGRYAIPKNLLKEMQSLSEKLAALNRFLSQSAGRALPFFDTLKNITKENKENLYWTKAAKQAFQELKKLIMELPTLTMPSLKETLYVYLAASAKAVSGVLMVDRNGRQSPMRSRLS